MAAAGKAADGGGEALVVGQPGQIFHGGGVVGDDAVHHAGLPDDFRQRARIDAGKANDALFFKKGVKAALGTEVGGSLAPLLDNIGTGTDGIMNSFRFV